jgi:hypothetical protein
MKLSKYIQIESQYFLIGYLLYFQMIKNQVRCITTAGDPITALPRGHCAREAERSAP